jgi:hypothetical protein
MRVDPRSGPVHGTRALAHVPRSKPQQQPQDAHLEQRVADFVCAVGVRGVADQELEHFSISGFETNVFSYSRLVSISILSGCFVTDKKSKKGFSRKDHSQAQVEDSTVGGGVRAHARKPARRNHARDNVPPPWSCRSAGARGPAHARGEFLCLVFIRSFRRRAPWAHASDGRDARRARSSALSASPARRVGRAARPIPRPESARLCPFACPGPLLRARAGWRADAVKRRARDSPWCRHLSWDPPSWHSAHLPLSVGSRGYRQRLRRRACR